MAKDKKSFLLYADLIHTVKQLPNDKAGELFKHVLSYVNDEDPHTDDILINIAFEPIKQSLKRDLQKYESTCNRNKTNGAKGGRPKNPNKPKKPTGLNGNPTKPKKADSDNGSDNGSDSGNDNVNDIKEITIGSQAPEKTNTFNFKKSLIDLGVEKDNATEWVKCRTKAKASSSKRAFDMIMSEVNKTNKTLNECIEICLGYKERTGKVWTGFKAEWLDNLNKDNGSRISKTEIREPAKADTNYGMSIEEAMGER